MKKIAIVYWTSTGNTESMADLVKAGILEGGATADLFNVSDISASEALNYDVLVLGCPAMGAETLDEMEMEPFFSELESSSLSGKDVALFGSYGWGDGEWMRTWQDRVSAAGGNLISDGVIACGEPDDEASEACRQLGLKIAKL